MAGGGLEPAAVDLRPVPGNRMVAPELQSWTADRIGATVHELDSSHASPVSRPEEIARIIGELL